MNKQLKFQSIIVCKNGERQEKFVSNPLLISLNYEINMKNLYTWDKYLQSINCKKYCECARISMFEYFAMCLKNLFNC